MNKEQEKAKAIYNKITSWGAYSEMNGISRETIEKYIAEGLKEYAKEYHEAETVKAFQQTGPMFLRNVDRSVFIKIPIYLVNGEEAKTAENLGLNDEYVEHIEVEAHIDSTKIMAVYPNSMPHEKDVECSQIIMDNDHPFLSPLPVKDILNFIKH